MTAKTLDTHNRWRSRTIAFRMSPEEADELDVLVKLSGLKKQTYITNRLLGRDIVVQGNPRVYKALKEELGAVREELVQLTDGDNLRPELLETIQMIAKIMDGMKGEGL